MPSPWLLCWKFEPSTYFFTLQLRSFTLSNKTELWGLPNTKGHQWVWVQKDAEIITEAARGWRRRFAVLKRKVKTNGWMVAPQSQFIDIFGPECYRSPLQFLYLSLQFCNLLIVCRCSLFWCRAWNPSRLVRGAWCRRVHDLLDCLLANGNMTIHCKKHKY